MTAPRYCSDLSDFSFPRLGVRHCRSEAIGTATGLFRASNGRVLLISAAHVIAWPPTEDTTRFDAIEMPALAQHKDKPATTKIAELLGWTPTDPGWRRSKSVDVDIACAAVEPEWIEPLEEVFGNQYLNPVELTSQTQSLTLRGGCNGARTVALQNAGPVVKQISIPEGSDYRRISLKKLALGGPGLGGKGDSGAAVFDETGGWVGIYIGRTKSGGVETGALIVPALVGLKALFLI